MPSGVMRLRAAKKGGGSLSIEHVKQSTKAHGGATGGGENGETHKNGSQDMIWKSYPTTKNPTGNESPHRGEHPN